MFFKNISMSDRQYFKLGIIIISFTLIPLCLLSFFNLPMGDDFYFGDIGRRDSALNAVKYWYNNWGGRYSQSFFLTVFNPLSYNSLKYFCLPPLILITMICILFYFIIYALTKKSLTKGEIIFTWSILIFFYFNFLPEIGETLYWISGSYTFQLGNISFLLLLFIIINIENITKKILNSFLALAGLITTLLISGFNEISMLYTSGILICFIILKLVLNKKASVSLILICIFSIIGTYISIKAPGNLVRASYTGGIIQNVPHAVLESFGRGIFYLVSWLPATILLTFLLWDQIRKIRNNVNVNNNIKPMGFLLSVTIFLIILSAGYLPSLVSTGWNPPRTVAPVFLVYIIGYFVLIIYYYDFLNKFIKPVTENYKFRGALSLILIIALSNNNNVMNAYKDITSGKAYKYNHEVNNVYKQLQNTESNKVFVYPLKYRPITLPVRWPDHYNRLVNNEWEEYFGKKIEMAKSD